MVKVKNSSIIPLEVGSGGGVRFKLIFFKIVNIIILNFTQESILSSWANFEWTIKMSCLQLSQIAIKCLKEKMQRQVLMKAGREFQRASSYSGGSGSKGEKAG